MNKKKFDSFKQNIHKQLKPKPTWKSLTGIFIFFFLPEIVAYFWGEELRAYCNTIINSTDDFMTKQIYKILQMFCENSLFNIFLGFTFLFWWLYERVKK